MEQPPLIDVEPEDGGKSRLMGCAGCIGKLIPVTVGLLLVSLLLMGVAMFIWGGDLEKKPEDEGAGTELVEGKKKGFAGVMEKVKRAVKGEKAPSEEAREAVVSGEGGAKAGQQAAAGGGGMAGGVEKSVALAESIGADAKSPAERDQLLKEKFGHLAEEGSLGGRGETTGGGAGQGSADLPPFGEEGGQVATATATALAKGEAEDGSVPKGVQKIRQHRGGSFGSSTGAATATGKRSQYQRWRGNFSTSGSDLEFEVIYQEAGGQLQFRCFVMPYDSQTAKLFRADRGDFLLSFNDSSGKRVVPADDELAIPLTKLTAFESQGKVSGWVARGIVPMNGQELSSLKSVKLGWDFDKDLGDWLKELKSTRGN